jgi:hypothetical protein
MNATPRNLLLTLILLGSLVAIATGWTDTDWQLVTYRYSPWHREQDTWEFNPYLIVNWWVAWQLGILRLVGGSLIFGILLYHLIWRPHYG